MSGGLTNNPIELLITLGVNGVTSKSNITNYIAELKSQLGSLDIDVTFKNKSGDFAKSILKEFEAIQKKAKETEDSIGGVGKKPNNNKPPIFDGFKSGFNDVREAVNAMEHFLKSKNFKYKIEMDFDKDGQQQVKRIVADMKNNLGQIETVHIKPIIEADGLVRFEQFKKVLNDTHTYKLQEEINKAIKVLDDFKNRGKLTATEYQNTLNVLNKAPNIKAVTAALDELKSKEKDAVFGDKIGESLVFTSQKLDELHNKLVRLEKTNGSNASAKRIGDIRKELEAISKIPISTSNEANIVAKRLADAEKKIAYASLSASDAKTFNNVMKQAKDEISKIREVSNLSESSIQKMYARLKNVPIGNLDQLNKELNKLKESTKHFSTQKLILNGIEQNSLNVKALNSQLERTVNLNRKYIDTNGYNALLDKIQKLGTANIRSVKDIEDVISRYKTLRQEVNTFSSAATQASRNSMTVMNAFKVAMERFPINIFYQINEIQVGIKLFELLETP